MSNRLLDQKKNGRFPFSYTTAAETDIRKLFAKVRKEQEKRKAPVTNLNARRGKA